MAPSSTSLHSIESPPAAWINPKAEKDLAIALAKAEMLLSTKPVDQPLAMAEQMDAIARRVREAVYLRPVDERGEYLQNLLRQLLRGPSSVASAFGPAGAVGILKELYTYLQALLETLERIEIVDRPGSHARGDGQAWRARYPAEGGGTEGSQA